MSRPVTGIDAVVDEPVTLINAVTVPPEESERFNVAEWGSGKALDQAKANPEWRASLQLVLDDPDLHITPRPVVYEVVVDVPRPALIELSVGRSIKRAACRPSPLLQLIIDGWCKACQLRGAPSEHRTRPSADRSLP